MKLCCLRALLEYFVFYQTVYKVDKCLSRWNCDLLILRFSRWWARSIYVSSFFGRMRKEQISPVTNLGKISTWLSFCLKLRCSYCGVFWIFITLLTSCSIILLVLCFNQVFPFCLCLFHWHHAMVTIWQQWLPESPHKPTWFIFKKCFIQYDL